MLDKCYFGWQQRQVVLFENDNISEKGTSIEIKNYENKKQRGCQWHNTIKKCLLKRVSQYTWQSSFGLIQESSSALQNPAKSFSTHDDVCLQLLRDHADTKCVSVDDGQLHGCF